MAFRLKTLYFWLGVHFTVTAGILGSMAIGHFGPLAGASAVIAAACWVFPSVAGSGT